MKPYSTQNYLPSSGLVLLVFGSVLLGIAVGVLAYFISNFIYFIVAFPIVVGGATMIAYYRLLQYTKVRHSLLTALVGFGTGILVAVAFYVTPYLVVRHNFISEAQAKYSVDAKTASNGFDKILIKKTESSGFWGFMKLRAIEGDQYSSYVMVNYLPVGEFKFTLKSTWAWIYWFLETLLFALPIAWLGFDVGKRAFNRSARDWYNPLPKQVASAQVERKEEMLSLLRKGDLSGISNLLAAEEEIQHPRLEFYEQRSNNKKGDILLSLKQTFRDPRFKIKRNIIGQWEIPQQDYMPFVDALNKNIEAG